MQDNNDKNISRRKALKYLGVGALGLVAATKGFSAFANKKDFINIDDGMTLRYDAGADTKVSLLGFGCMRFPTNADRSIDEKRSTEMIDYAYKHGVNYFDTAWPYHGGASETFIGKVLKQYPRESFHLTSKLPTPRIKDLALAKEIFEKQLEKCQVKYFDYYLMHTLSSQSSYDSLYEDGGVYDYLMSEKKAGRIRRLGFSFHGNLDFFKYLLQKHQWDVVQIQLNYYDWDDERQQSGALYDLLAEHKIPCIVMEPIRGGMLANLTPAANAILKEAEPNKSAASWALRFAGSLPNVLTVLSGMSAMEHVVDNVNTMTDFKPLTDAERKTLNTALAVLKQTTPIRCTTCRYCMDCPFGVDIPGNFTFYNKCVNEGAIPDLENASGAEFERRKKIFLDGYYSMPESERADKCRKCKVCIKKCPQHIRIPDELERIVKMVNILEGK